MDVTKILAELRSERAQLEEAILSLERLARGRENAGAVHQRGSQRNRPKVGPRRMRRNAAGVLRAAGTRPQPQLALLRQSRNRP